MVTRYPSLIWTGFYNREEGSGLYKISAEQMPNGEFIFSEMILGLCEDMRWYPVPDSEIDNLRKEYFERLKSLEFV